MGKYKMSFWNYCRAGNLSSQERYFDDLEKLGMNLPMSEVFLCEESDKAAFLATLDEYHKRGMQVFISDKRTKYEFLEKVGEETFRKEAAQAVADFGSHPAVFGFLVGDEPSGKNWDIAVKAFQIMQELAPNLVNFINFLPAYWDGFENSLGCSADGYASMLDAFIEQTGMKVLGYDYYGQCESINKTKRIDGYFKNLNLFGKIARKHNIPFFTSLLSIGHWMYRCPNEDDFRWQISTAVGHGVVGIMWFFVFQTGLHIENYRTGPVDVFGERSETFEWLSRQNRIFMQRTAQVLENYEFERVEHWGDQFGDFPRFQASTLVKTITPVLNPQPLAISYFKNKDGGDCVGITNLSQTEATMFDAEFGGPLSKYTGRVPLAPGQMRIYTEDITV